MNDTKGILIGDSGAEVQKMIQQLQKTGQTSLGSPAYEEPVKCQTMQKTIQNELKSAKNDTDKKCIK